MGQIVGQIRPWEELRQQLGGVPRDVKETITQYCKGILGKAAKQEYD